MFYKQRFQLVYKKDINDLNGLHGNWRGGATVTCILNNHHEQVTAGNLLNYKGPERKNTKKDVRFWFTKPEEVIAIHLMTNQLCPMFLPHINVPSFSVKENNKISQNISNSIYNLIGYFTQKRKFCHNLLTLQTCSVSFFRAQIKIFWKYGCKNTLEVNCLVTKIIQTIFFCAQQKETHTGLKEFKSFLFWVNYPFKYLYLIYILKSTFKTESKYLIITNLSIKYMFCDICKQV